MEKVSWVILTYNRFDIVSRAFKHNLDNAGVPFNQLEVIWVDNGSIQPESETSDLSELMNMIPAVRIFNRDNLGVAKGYNRGMVLATGEYIAITGCDRLMPKDWLSRMLNAFEKVPNMGCVSCYSEDESTIQDRYPTKKKIEEVSGVRFMRALPFEARLFRRSMLSDVGYFHEGFGLYGYEDCHWGPRFVNVAKDKYKGLICCTLEDFKAIHLGVKDSVEYKDFKKKENEPWKWELVKKLASEGYPKFTPYL